MAQFAKKNVANASGKTEWKNSAVSRSGLKPEDFKCSGGRWTVLERGRCKGGKDEFERPKVFPAEIKATMLEESVNPAVKGLISTRGPEEAKEKSLNPERQRAKDARGGLVSSPNNLGGRRSPHIPRTPGDKRVYSPRCRNWGRE